MSDEFMKRALALGKSVLGQTWPNPAVGAVLVKDGKVVGEGATAKGGRPHAETIAIEQAGENAKGATLYVTLEPCSHHGKTSPCTDAIIQAGIKEAIIACRDVNPKVDGIAALQKAGIKVIEIDSAEARETHRGFFSLVEKNRPFIAMKIAVSKDGKISEAPGKRTDITGKESREHAMQLRAEFDAILTGIGTVLADDPLLTVRIPGTEHRSPVRVVMDSQGRLPANAKVRPAWIYTREDDVIKALTERSITRLLIEGGQEVNTHFLPIADRLYLYQSPDEIGVDGMDALVGGLSLIGWQQMGDVLQLGRDSFSVWERK